MEFEKGEEFEGGDDDEIAGEGSPWSSVEAPVVAI